MKQNLVENQYIQLAKEQFCQVMKKIPFVSDIEIISTGLQKGFGDFHAIVHYSDKQPIIQGRQRILSNETLVLYKEKYCSILCCIFIHPCYNIQI